MSGVEINADPAPGIGRDWPGALVCCAVLIAMLIAFSTEALVNLGKLWWNDDSYGHSLLIVPIIVYLLWREKDDLAQMSPAPSYWGIPLLFIVSVAWFAGHMTHTFVLEQLAIVLFVSALCFTLFGWRIYRVLFFPLAFLLVTIPVWEIFVPVLRDYTALMTYAGVRAMGIPIFLKGASSRSRMAPSKSPMSVLVFDSSWRGSR